MFVNSYGTKKNLRIATKAKNVVDTFLRDNFTNYTGELIDETPHIIKLYASGRESCIFAIFAFAVCFYINKVNPTAATCVACFEPDFLEYQGRASY